MIDRDPSEIPIDPRHLAWEYVRSRGPGGQKVNKTSSKVRLRFDLQGCDELSPEVKNRLSRLAKQRITEEGWLILESETSRQQNRNKQICMEKLQDLIRQALIPPKKRRPTRPTQGSRLRRIQQKQHRSRLKSQRQKNHLGQ